MQALAQEWKVDASRVRAQSQMIGYAFDRAQRTINSSRAQSWLFESGPVSRSCLACVRVVKTDQPVFCQCVNSRLPAQQFCGKHALQKSRRFGHWNVFTNAVADCSDRVLQEEKGAVAASLCQPRLRGVSSGFAACGTQS